MNLMLESKLAELDGLPVPTIVDLGYIICGPDVATIARADALLDAGISKRNFQVTGFNRLMVKLPPARVAAILKRFPILPGATYWRATHHWRGLGKGETSSARNAFPAKGE